MIYYVTHHCYEMDSVWFLIPKSAESVKQSTNWFGHIMPIFTGRNEVVAKVIFLHPSVIHSVHRGGGLPQCMLGYHAREQTPPSRTRHPPPQDQTPPRGRPPRTRHSPRSRHPPLEQTPHPPGADSSIRSTSGYAAYWNAFLFKIQLSTHFCTIMRNHGHNKKIMTLSNFNYRWAANYSTFSINLSNNTFHSMNYNGNTFVGVTSYWLHCYSYFDTKGQVGVDTFVRF